MLFEHRLTDYHSDTSQGTNVLAAKVHLEVSAASAGAIKAVEEAGGTVTCVHFNALGEDIFLSETVLHC